MKAVVVLWKGNKLKDGSHPIKVRVSRTEEGKTQTKYYPLGFSAKVGEWNPKVRRVKNKVNVAEINSKILKIENAIEKNTLSGTYFDVEKVIQSILNPMPKSEYTPATYFTKYKNDGLAGLITNKRTGRPLKPSYLNGLDTSKNRLEAFENYEKVSLRFSDVTADFYNKFVTYLRFEHPFKGEKGLAENSITKTIKALKRIMEHSKKIHGNMDFKDFPASYTDADNIALNDEQIDLMLNCDTSGKSNLAREQIRFAVAYNFLLRFSDSITVAKNSVFKEGDRHYFKMSTEKTEEAVIIPVMPRVYAALKENNFILPPISLQKSNLNIKKLGKLAGLTDTYALTEFRGGKKAVTNYEIWEILSTHTTRRSAATNLYKAGTDLYTIMLLGGWKSIKQLQSYLKIDKLDAAKKVANIPHFNK